MTCYSAAPTTQGSSATSLALKAKPFKPRFNEQVLPIILRRDNGGIQVATRVAFKVDSIFELERRSIAAHLQ